METERKPRSKSRSLWDKEGSVKRTRKIMLRVLREIEEVKLSQRTIFAGLKSLFHFEKPRIQKIVCADEVDEEILELLHQAGNYGILPKDLASQLSSFRIRRHQVSRRILRMNKRLEKEIGEKLVEKRGWHWALTSFGFEVWGETEFMSDTSRGDRSIPLALTKDANRYARNFSRTRS